MKETYVSTYLAKKLTSGGQRKDKSASFPYISDAIESMKGSVFLLRSEPHISSGCTLELTPPATVLQELCQVFGIIILKGVPESF